MKRNFDDFLIPFQVVVQTLDPSTDLEVAFSGGLFAYHTVKQISYFIFHETSPWLPSRGVLGSAWW